MAASMESASVRHEKQYLVIKENLSTLLSASDMQSLNKKLLSLSISTLGRVISFL